MRLARWLAEPPGLSVLRRDRCAGPKLVSEIVPHSPYGGIPPSR